MTQYYQISGTGYPIISPIMLDGFTAYEVGKEPKVLMDAFTAQERIEAQIKAKQDRVTALSCITVTTSLGKVFDGREKDIPLMSGAIQAAEVLGLVEHQWKLHDNSVQMVSIAELKEALALSMQAIGSIKVN